MLFYKFFFGFTLCLLLYCTFTTTYSTHFTRSNNRCFLLTPFVFTPLINNSFYHQSTTSLTHVHLDPSTPCNATLHQKTQLTTLLFFNNNPIFGSSLTISLCCLLLTALYNHMHFLVIVPLCSVALLHITTL